MSLEHRKEQWNAIQDSAFDVVIVGGGINGAAVYRQLCAEGYRVLLVEKGDFASGTSQASAMMIWGGLIHLRQLDLLGVWRLCAGRDHLIREMKDRVRPRTFRLLSSVDSGRRRSIAQAALYSYWLLGCGRRSRPRYRKSFPELSFLNPDKFPHALEYEEACVEPSDARFILEWILSYQSCDQLALNYCQLRGGKYDVATGAWCLELADSLMGLEAVVRAKWVVNAAGTWTDYINQRFNIESPYKHIFAKGVFIGLQRNPQHYLPLMIETREYQDCMSLIPWGPISLWGATETRTLNLEEGFSVKPEDVHYLLQELNQHLSQTVRAEEIISLRCGVRPLVVKGSFSETCDTNNLSRRHRIHRDRNLPWLSIYGGKLTGCMLLAKTISNILRVSLKRCSPHVEPPAAVEPPELKTFPGLNEKVPSARGCAEKEMCRTLEDYLRRRTNISQWVPRGGLGRDGENRQHLIDLAGAFHGDNRGMAEAAVNSYQKKIEQEFDAVLAKCIC